jgi:hypothetical protein
MRYANPAYLKTVLEKIDKAIKTYKEEEFERNAIRVNKEYDQAAQEYISDKKIREAVSEDEQERLYYLREQGLAEEAEDILRDFDREYYLGYRADSPDREDELANLLKWIKEDAIDQKAYGSATLDGDHVYPLPVELF